MKRIYLKHLFLFLLIFPSNVLLSQVLNPVKWSFSVNQGNGNEAELIITAKIDKNWHLYSQYMEEGGPILTRFNFDKSPNYQLVGKTSEAKPESEFDDIFKMNVKYFSHQAVFKQKIKILTSSDFKITGNYEYMVCNEGSCIPFLNNSFEFKVKGVSGLQANDFAKDSKDSNTAENLTKVSDSSELKSKIDTLNIVQKSDISENINKDKSLIIIFLIAFIAGILTLITPCVFPMIPMTVSFFIINSNDL